MTGRSDLSSLAHRRVPEPTDRSAPRHGWWDASRGMRPSTWLLLASLVAGAAFRLLLFRTSLYELDSDQAIVFLMPLRFLQGDVEVFFWGQTYGGTLLQLTAAVAYWIAGATPFVLTVVSVLWWLVAAVALRQTVFWTSGRRAADLAASLFWWPGLMLTVMSTEDQAFYGTSLAVGLTCTWLAVRPGAPSWRRWALLGLFCGLAVWTSPAAAAYAAAAGLVMLVRAFAWRGLLALVLGGLVGGSPWLFINLSLGFPSLHGSAATVGTPQERLLGFFEVLIPTAFRLWWPAGGRGDTAVLYGVVVGLAAFALSSLVLAGRLRDVRPLVLPVAGVLSVAVVVLAGFPVVESSSRYVAFVLPVIAAAAGTVLAWSAVLALVAALAAVTATAGTAWAETDGFASDGISAFGAGVPELASYLEDRGHELVYADYWLAYRLTAQAREDVIAAPLTDRRYEPYERAVASAGETVVVVYPGQHNDELLATSPGLPPHTRTLVGGYAVFEFDGRFDPDQLPVEQF